jgi:hypothetical protein
MGQHLEGYDRQRLSRHALMRSQQRGIRLEMVDYVLREADIDLHAGGGCRSYCISFRKMAALLKAGAPAAWLDRAMRVVVIWSERLAEVVTVLHDHGRNGRCYRRQHPTRKN